MILADAFAPAVAAYKAQVVRETWGHLAPEPRKSYQGHVLFALGAYGDIVPLDAEFDGLDDNHWFFQHMQDYIGEQVMKRSEKLSWGVWRFEGTYTRQKNGKGRFSGKVRPMRCVPRFAGSSR